MQDNTIHIKLENREVIANKKNLLLIEKELLESMKHIKKYQLLRKKEISLKGKVKNDLSQLKKIIKDVESTLPEREVEFEPQQYTKEISKKEIKKAIKKRTIEKRRNDVEREIDDIKIKLAELDQESGL